ALQVPWLAFVSATATASARRLRQLKRHGVFNRCGVGEVRRTILAINFVHKRDSYAFDAGGEIREDESSPLRLTSLPTLYLDPIVDIDLNPVSSLLQASDHPNRTVPMQALLQSEVTSLQLLVRCFFIFISVTALTGVYQNIRINSVDFGICGRYNAGGDRLLFCISPLDDQIVNASHRWRMQPNQTHLKPEEEDVPNLNAWNKTWSLLGVGPNPSAHTIRAFDDPVNRVLRILQLCKPSSQRVKPHKNTRNQLPVAVVSFSNTNPTLEIHSRKLTLFRVDSTGSMSPLEDLSGLKGVASEYSEADVDVEVEGEADDELEKGENPAGKGPKGGAQTKGGAWFPLGKIGLRINLTTKQLLIVSKIGAFQKPRSHAMHGDTIIADSEKKTKTTLVPSLVFSVYRFKQRDLNKKVKTLHRKPEIQAERFRNLRSLIRVFEDLSPSSFEFVMCTVLV
ncbi:hypothetical protein HID58_089810, partial [Brassica napus]